MLVCIGMLNGRSYAAKFAYFLYSFAVWDLSYYIWLKAALNWPETFMTSDLLFVIPVPWIAPVLAMLVCCLTVIPMSLSVIHLDEKNAEIKSCLRELFLALGGAFLIFMTFIQDYSLIIYRGGFFMKFKELITSAEFRQAILSHAPCEYNWYLFCLGECMIITGYLLFQKKHAMSASSLNAEPSKPESFYLPQN